MTPVRTPGPYISDVGTARPARVFATTHWSLVLQAADAGNAGGQNALEQLCRTYWPALYGFARWRGQSAPDAEDLTQGFFTDLLARGAIARADGARGRFRTFLLASFQNYMSHQHARAHSRKRGGGCEIISLEGLADAEGHFLEEPATTESPGQHFDRQWARNLLAQALAAVDCEYAKANKGALFAELKTALWGQGGEINYAQTSARLGMSKGALKVAVHRLRHRFGEQLRAEVARTVADPEEIETEIQQLLAALEV